jgi:hypothetical protein
MQFSASQVDRTSAPSQCQAGPDSRSAARWPPERVTRYVHGLRCRNRGTILGPTPNRPSVLLSIDQAHLDDHPDHLAAMMLVSRLVWVGRVSHKCQKTRILFCRSTGMLLSCGYERTIPDGSLFAQPLLVQSILHGSFAAPTLKKPYVRTGPTCNMSENPYTIG